MADIGLEYWSRLAVAVMMIVMTYGTIAQEGLTNIG